MAGIHAQRVTQSGHQRAEALDLVTRIRGEREIEKSERDSERERERERERGWREGGRVIKGSKRKDRRKRRRRMRNKKRIDSRHRLWRVPHIPAFLFSGTASSVPYAFTFGQ